MTQNPGETTEHWRGRTLQAFNDSNTQIIKVANDLKSSKADRSVAKADFDMAWTEMDQAWSHR